MSAQSLSSDVDPDRLREKGPLLRIRLLSSLGLYPYGQIESAKGTYHVDERLAFIAVRTDEKRALKYWSELTFLTFEEIRFLSALLLSMRPDYGVLRIYPSGAHITHLTSNKAELYERAESFAAVLKNSRSTLSIPLNGGFPYQVSQQKIDNDRYRKLVTSISIRDHLMMRGLSAILKADMLQVHREFEEEANTILYIAMEVAFQLTLRNLRELGNSNPSALDAGNFLHSTFPNNSPGMKFFEDYYEDRIKTFHPHSRLGTFAFPPLLASHAYGLRAGLISMFQYLITKEQWYTLWD
jgi:hypothetical protein